MYVMYVCYVCMLCMYVIFQMKKFTKNKVNENKKRSSYDSLRPKKKDSCVQVSEVKKIRVGRSKNIFILDFFFDTHVQRLQ